MSSNKKPRLLTKQVGFAEGPLWHPDGYLLFSDQEENCIKRITPHGKMDIYIENSGCDEPSPGSRPDSLGSNGLIWLNGKLTMCRHGAHSIATYENGKFTTLVDIYNGKWLNSPNDLIAAKDGTIYFSDPPYGIDGQELQPADRQPVAGVYSYKDGELKLLWSGLQYPNGLCFSPDEKILYVSSNHEADEGIFKAEITADGPLQFELFTATHADGILGDEQGNVYTASGDNVYKFNPAGEKIDTFEIGTTTSNINWGGENGKDLYTTCYNSVWVIENVKE